MEEGIKHSGHAASFNPKLEEQLKNPELKDQVISNLEYLEPENARELARLMLWSDSAFSFGLMGQLPRSLNFVVAFFDELGQQLQNVPPELLRQFASEMARNVDMKSMAALPAAYTPLLAAFNQTFGDSSGSFLNNETLESAKLFNNLVSLSNRILTENPELCEKVVVSFLQTVDKNELQNLHRNILSLCLNHLEQDQVSAFLINTSGRLAASLAESPQLSRSMIRSCIIIFWGALKGSFKRVRKEKGTTT